ncbi:CBS-domain-containing membrane protein [Desulfosporosinus sp. I2]|uniref:HPP family protein n=1 Tax=Desulfosporosinus sp. I2 TaxID=1617025 RepID=UPI00061E82F3|nr:HPP family protein [Desulfosporosinus sp. I2]KJR45989.1 CBS-domain-containing membrane protein [Desulfosporosinus sp. I2]
MQEVNRLGETETISTPKSAMALIRRVATLLIKYISKMKGYKRSTPLVSPPTLDVIITWVGAFVGITAIVFYSQKFDVAVVTSFGASAVLIYGVPDAPLSQPRNVFFGHTLSAAAGVATFMMFGLTWWSPALGTALALVVMLLTKTTHPPGGATALFAVLSKANSSYIVTPIAAGAVILIIIGLLVNNLSPNRHYPRYWF